MPYYEVTIPSTHRIVIDADNPQGAVERGREVLAEATDIPEGMALTPYLISAEQLPGGPVLVREATEAEAEAAATYLLNVIDPPHRRIVRGGLRLIK